MHAREANSMNKTLNRLKEYEIWFFRLAAFSGALGAISIAAATQVWLYPYPRTILIMGAGRSMIATMWVLGALAFALIWQKTLASYSDGEGDEQTIFIKLGMFLIRSSIVIYIAMMILFLITSGALTECVHFKNGDLCTKTAERFTAADEKFLQWKKIFGVFY